MRDAARIDRLLALIRRAWERHPDHRLGQLLSNCTIGMKPRQDIFYLEDDALEDRLQELMGEPNDH